MSKILPFTLLSLAAGLCCPLLAVGPAMADDVSLPALRTGLWERSMTNGDSPANASKSCMDQATEEKMLKVGMDKIKAMGGTSSFSGGDGQYQMKSSVVVQGHTMTMVDNIHVIDDTKIETVTRIHTDPPMAEGQSPDREITANSNWVGPCPADMLPGDTVVNGRKFNVLTDPPQH